MSGGCCLATGSRLVSGLRKLILRCLGPFWPTVLPLQMDVDLPQEDIGYVHTASLNDALTYIPFVPHQLLSFGPDSLSSGSSSARSSVLSTPLSSPALCDTPTSDFDANSLYLNPEQDYLAYTQQEYSMPKKKRTSLSSILIPPFLLYPLPSLSDPSRSPRRSSTRTRSPSGSEPAPAPSPQLSETALASSRSSPPPDFLLDEDPFANYTGARPLQPHYGSSTSPPRSRPASLSRRTSVKQPRSPLATEPSSPVLSPSSSPPIPCTRLASSPTRTPSSLPVSGRQLRPAYTRPAFAARPSLPSLHTLSQTDFNYPIKARKGTLGARLPLEPWDVSVGSDSVSQEAPSFHDLDHDPDHHHSAEYPLGPGSYISEDLHTDDTPDDTAEAHGIYKDAQFVRSPENPHMFASLFEVLSTFSPSSPSISSSSSSTSSLSVPSPDVHGGESPAQSSNRSSSDESVPADILFDDDHSIKRFDLDGFHYSQSVDFFSMPGGFSEADSFQPGTSAGTIRPLVNSMISDGISSHHDDDDWPSSYGEYATPELDEADMFDERAEDVYEAVDGNDQEDRRHRRAQGYGDRRSSNGYSNDSQDHRQTNGGDGLQGNGHQDSGSNGRGGGGGDDRRKDERDWSSAFSTPSDSEDEESEEEGTRHSTHQSHSTAPQEVSSSGDDVPLAQSIPTALQAQRTIQKQVRDAKDERRRLRALRRQRQQTQQADRQQTPTQVLPDKIGSSTQHIAAQRAPSYSRSRTRTLPSNTARPIVAEDLARRLRDIQDPNASLSLSPRHQASPPESTSHSDRPARRPGEHARNPSANGQDRPLRPSRSFHRATTRDTAQAQPVPVPPLTHDMYRLGRSATTATRPTKQHDPFETLPSVPSAHKSSRRPQTSDGAHGPSTTPFNFSVFQRVPAPSNDTSDPSSHSQVISKEAKQVSWQQRIFVVDLQRFNTLTMSPSTTAKEVMDALERQGQLANWAVSQDFGMERPIRHFEIVSEVINSWDKDKSVNLLVAKKTPLATLLNASAIPTSSPVFSTYVEWESKPRKWSKRWLELREQGLWLSKKDNGKDEIFLCSLANFDAYTVTRPHKPPKPYVFAVKSTDNLSFFENKADYVHLFCCSEKDGRTWLESILLARSYFINQDRNTLSVAGNQASGVSSKTLSRSGTRKGSRNVQQPLVQVSATTPLTAQAYKFEPGSLLAKR
ncbi:hypothetical protein EI94DRAFT_1744007 [Lactarius quietus]|nr:hypothetical protein EI94DRAFT_1744007 [Lactarius quietus]